MMDLAPPPESGPRILLYDIETAPALVWVWNQWQTNVIDTEQDWYMLCFAYRWYGKRKTHFVSIYQDPAFVPDTPNDRYVAERLAMLFDQADVLVAHNGDKFDLRKGNARFLFHGIDPPSPCVTIDTKKEAARYFANYSNSLRELCRMLGIGTKLAHQDFAIWRRCMAGDSAAWKIMETYNRHDVFPLLEGLYEKLIPWIGSPGHMGGVNYGHWAPGEVVCPKCGGRHLIKRGFHPHRTKFSEFQTFQCRTCGGYSRARTRKAQPDGGVAAV